MALDLGFVDNDLIRVVFIGAQTFQPVQEVQQVRHRLGEGNLIALVLPVLSDVVIPVSKNDLNTGHHSDAHILQVDYIERMTIVLIYDANLFTWKSTDYEGSVFLQHRL